MSIKFRTWLAEQIKQRGLNNSQLGRHIGVSGAAVGRWLQGVRQPDDESITKLAEYFMISPTEIYRLLDRLSEPPRDPHLEILESLWDKTPDWKKEDIVLQLRATLEKQERERAARAARRKAGESETDTSIDAPADAN
jgi:transcriptional regulator with XRE-family HTH domain